ncbi:hypothetical protein [Streptomyces sp. NPDC017260]|uniref:hypothetical protein n=1 Tax=unclassified Streptomyces TaxID=2593676 RepID=UPI0037AE741E
MSAAASRRLRAIPVDTCRTCVQLAARGRDNDQPDAGRALARLIDHCIDVHGATAIPRADCDGCHEHRLKENYGALWVYWARVHYLMHRLGLVTDSPYPRTGHKDSLYPLRYEDPLPPEPSR